jgi:hypothetical protein
VARAAAISTRLELLAPVALVGLPVTLLPAAAVLYRARRCRATLAALGLGTPPLAGTLLTALGAALAAALLVVAAAQPALAHAHPLRVRTDAQLYLVFDTSRSMDAREAPHSPTRFARAVLFARAFRDELPEIPAGIASFTDRLMPHLLPTSDLGTFRATLQEAVGVDRPPPLLARFAVATSYSLLAELPTGGSFAGTARKRLLVLLTDGESRDYSPADVVAALARTHTRLLVVRFWSPTERVYVGGRDAGYRPATASTKPFDELGRRSVGGRVFGDGDVTAAAAAARRYFGSGPTAAVAVVHGATPLAPWVALASLVPLALVTLRSGGGRRARIRRSQLAVRPLARFG